MKVLKIAFVLLILVGCNISDAPTVRESLDMEFVMAAYNNAWLKGFIAGYNQPDIETRKKIWIADSLDMARTIDKYYK